MNLIVDTNVVVSSLIKSGNTRQVLLHPSLNLFLPDYSLDELREHWDFLVRKSKLSSGELGQVLQDLLLNVSIIREQMYAEWLGKAKGVTQNVDIEDAPFIALALSFHNDGIWSQDKHLHRQSAVRVWRTEELLELMEKGMIR
jgi:predicted nucleic acid-binding protein